MLLENWLLDSQVVLTVMLGMLELKDFMLVCYYLVLLVCCGMLVCWCYLAYYTVLPLVVVLVC
jgi:hypothetical protein